MSRRSAQFDAENQLNLAPGNNGAGGATPGSSKTPAGSNGDSSRDSYLDRLVNAGAADLLNEDSQKNTILNLATLQRMLLFQLQLKIIEKVGPLVKRRFENGNPLEDTELKKALADYGDT
jgi:hypothetical protein